MIEKQSYQEPFSEVDKRKDDEMEIDLMAIFYKIITVRGVLCKAAGVGVIIAIVVALSIPKQYTVKVTLSPEMGNAKGSNGLAGLAASFLGDGALIGESTDALNASLSADIVSSTPFLLELLEMEVSVSKKDDKMTLGSYLDEESSPWWDYLIGFPGIVIGGVKSLFGEDTVPASGGRQGTIELTKEVNEKINFLKKKISASIDKKTAITSITVTLQNPQVTAVIADSVVHKLQEYIIGYRTSKVKEDCAYLERLFKERQQEYYAAQRKYADYVDAHDNVVLQSVRAEQERLQNDMSLAYQIYSQVANQLQVSRAKVQEEKPVFAVVEPAVVPLKPSGMGLKIYILLFVFLSVSGTLVWVLFGKSLLASLRKELKNKEIEQDK